MLESLRNKRIMVVAAHPDDELLGLGATMHRLINDYGVTTHVVMLSAGITSRSNEQGTQKWKKELDIQRKNIYDAQKAIGYHSVSIYDFPDNRFDSVDLLDLIKTVEEEKRTFNPEVIFTHHQGDTNIDHRIAFEAVITACRPLYGELVKCIITFETPSSTEWQAFNYPNPFLPNFFVEICKANLDAKIKGMESYIYEKREYPHPRSPQALKIISQNWGIKNGIPLAEAFVIIRYISK
jgi:LmbE family N-acetylglucosaminyl deacetylase